MRTTLFSWALLLVVHLLQSQTVEETYPKTLWCPNDTFVLKYSNYPASFPYPVSGGDKMSPGTNASPDLAVTIYYGKDSIRLPYHNHFPYAHLLFINFESPKGKKKLRLHFNEMDCYFPKSYIDKNKGQAHFDIPEPYELANIIWLLSPSGQRATDMYKEGDYYHKVLAYFTPYLKHPVFKQLDFADSLYFANYYAFRENSFAYNFKDERPGSHDCRLLFNGPYYMVYDGELADSSLFGKLKPLVEDFAATSKFREFYQSNRDFYAREIERQKELLPVKTMWDWLENQFPKPKIDSYRIIFSPLIGGSHSTQHYQVKEFQEAVMFICGPERVDQSEKKLSEKQKEGLMSGIVFTEIDHNYVNPATNKHAALVDSIFSKRKTWVSANKSNNYYKRSIHVFNEYMTHAAFCLYMQDTYEAQAADFIIKNRETIMVENRGFIKFREFNAELMRLRKENKNLKVVDLYPLILAWCRTQL